MSSYFSNFAVSSSVGNYFIYPNCRTRNCDEPRTFWVFTKCEWSSQIQKNVPYGIHNTYV